MGEKNVRADRVHLDTVPVGMARRTVRAGLRRNEALQTQIARRFRRLTLRSATEASQRDAPTIQDSVRMRPGGQGFDFLLVYIGALAVVFTAMKVKVAFFFALALVGLPLQSRAAAFSGTGVGDIPDCPNDGPADYTGTPLVVS